jgi:hypothetical protein
MRVHPALSMTALWTSCAVAFAILPFQMLGQPTEVLGFAGLALFLLAFVTGSLLVPTHSIRTPPVDWRRVDTRLAETTLACVSLFATLMLLVDVRDKSLFDLVIAYELRSAAADALLHAEQSSSSVWFQAAFLLYPAAFPYMAVHLIHARRVRWTHLLVFGVLPVLLATLAMGGRSPLMYALMVIVLSLSARRRLNPAPRVRRAKRMVRTLSIALALLAASVLLTAYFSAVFEARASLGESDDIWATAETLWNVGFKGTLYRPIEALLGEGGAYQLFAFSWYFLQGIVMSNFLFSGYDGPLQLGIYGIDIVSAVMRRVDPDRVAMGFDTLLTLGTYGFLPSAWGSLYVDFGLLGLVACVCWGAFAAWVWRRTVVDRRARWLTVAPFVTIGIVFSLVNTPFGFSNGFVTHGWLLLAFVLCRPRAQRRAIREITPAPLGAGSPSPEPGRA